MGSTSEEPLSEEEAEKAEQEKMMEKMTCSKCGLTEFTSDMALKNHREEKHSFEARVMDAFERASLPIDALQIEKLEKVRIA